MIKRPLLLPKIKITYLLSFCIFIFMACQEAYVPVPPVEVLLPPVEPILNERILKKKISEKRIIVVYKQDKEIALSLDSYAVNCVLDKVEKSLVDTGFQVFPRTSLSRFAYDLGLNANGDKSLILFSQKYLLDLVVYVSFSADQINRMKEYVVYALLDLKVIQISKGQILANTSVQEKFITQGSRQEIEQGMMYIAENLAQRGIDDLLGQLKHRFMEQDSIVIVLSDVSQKNQKRFEDILLKQELEYSINKKDSSYVIIEIFSIEDPNRFVNRLKDLISFHTLPLTPEQGHYKGIIFKEDKTVFADTNEIFAKNVILQRWAVIIGISVYQDTRIPSLRYAAADAKSFYDWIISPKGGKYEPSRVKLLLNEEARGENIKNILFDWLKQPIEEDMIIIYFAGHGSSESPDNLQNLFLLPYDTKYDAIASTGFPMWDIETALKRFIKAKKVVVIADACHSAGIGESFDIVRRTNRGIKLNLITSGLQNLSNVADGIAIFSASSDKQFSQESKKWGGGHGVFTYYLLEGLKGKADHNGDRKVNLGELILYVSEQVRRSTNNAQTPIVSGRFDTSLIIGK